MIRGGWRITSLTILMVILSVGEGVAAEHVPDTTANQKLINVNYQELQQVMRSYKGEKIVLLNIWATWCGPCVEELPHLVEIQQQYPEKVQVVLLSADLKKDRGRVVPFLEELGVTWTTYFKAGDNQRFLNQLSDQWSGALPYTKIKDKEGRVVAEWQGGADYKKFEQYIQQAMEDTNESN